MSALGQLSLIRFLDFYLMLVFLLSVGRRIDLYRTVVSLVFSGPKRWPNLLKLVRKHRMIFLTWGTVLPAVLALVLSVTQLLASRLVWPEAGHPPHGLTVERLLHFWWAAAMALPLGLAMLLFDGLTILRVGEINKALLESHFDTAEFWLRSPTAHVVKIVTFGFINPRRRVAVEVQKALVDASQLLNANLWWMVTQISLRLAFGLSLWLTWVLTHAA